MGKGGVGIQLIDAVVGSQPILRRVVIAVFLRGKYHGQIALVASVSTSSRLMKEQGLRFVFLFTQFRFVPEFFKNIVFSP